MPHIDSAGSVHTGSVGGSQSYGEHGQDDDAVFRNEGRPRSKLDSTHGRVSDTALSIFGGSDKSVPASGNLTHVVVPSPEGQREVGGEPNVQVAGSGELNGQTSPSSQILAVENTYSYEVLNQLGSNSASTQQPGVIGVACSKLSSFLGGAVKPLKALVSFVKGLFVDRQSGGHNQDYSLGEPRGVEHYGPADLQKYFEARHGQPSSTSSEKE